MGRKLAEPTPCGTLPRSIVAALRFLVISLGVIALCSCDPADPNYQVDLGTPNESAAQAISSLNSRLDTVKAWAACGSEFEFLQAYINDDPDPLKDSSTGEGVLERALGKLAWLRHDGVNESNCVEFRWVTYDQLNIQQAWRDEWTAPHPKPKTTHKWFRDRIDAINARFLMLFQMSLSAAGTTVCGVPPFSIQDDDPNRRQDDQEIIPGIRVSVQIDVACLKREINAAVMNMHVVGSPGTDKAPCHIVSNLHGDWDTALKDVVRLYYYDGRFGRNGILGAAERKHIVEDVFSLEGPPTADTYAPWDCGFVSDHHLGSAQQRADERAFYDAPFFRALGDLLIFFLVIAGAIAIAGAALAALGAPVAAAILATTLTLGAGALLFIRIPETENHLLLMNSSRYLINKIIIDQLEEGDDRDGFVKDQAEVKQWLMDRMRRIAREDFVEYNAKPYQRYSIVALLNLYDYAGDPELATAAQVVLEFASAKFAAGSAQGRRIGLFDGSWKPSRMKMRSLTTAPCFSWVKEPISRSPRCCYMRARAATYRSSRCGRRSGAVPPKLPCKNTGARPGTQRC